MNLTRRLRHGCICCRRRLRLDTLHDYFPHQLRWGDPLVVAQDFKRRSYIVIKINFDGSHTSAPSEQSRSVGLVCQEVRCDRWYNSSMKEKTSVTLSPEVLT